jgi:hypothetical protein
MNAPRPMREVLLDWAPELAERLGRPVDHVLTKGLSAYDFSSSDTVEIRQPTGMTIRCLSAFAVIRPAAKQVAVFTEHDGYLEFDLVEGAVVAEISERLYHHE